MGDGVEAKVAVLERRVDDLHDWAKDLKDAVEKSAASNASAIAELTGVVKELAGMKSDHERHATEITSLRRRQHELGNEFGRVSLLENKVEVARVEITSLRAFKDDVTRTIPNMQLASGWVFKASLFVMAGLGAVALAVILKGAAGG